MGPPSRSIEDGSAESYVDCRGPIQENSKRNNISKWARESFCCSCNILSKIVAAFCPHSKNLPGTNKNNGLISLSKGSSRLWLLGRSTI